MRAYFGSGKLRLPRGIQRPAVQFMRLELAWSVGETRKKNGGSEIVEYINAKKLGQRDVY